MTSYFWALLLVALTMLVSLPCKAKPPEPRDFVVTLDGTGEAPAQVCVISRTSTASDLKVEELFGPDGAAKQSATKDIQAQNALETLRRRDECGAEGQLELAAEKRDYQLSCRNNEQRSGASEPRALLLLLGSTDPSTPPNLLDMDLNGRTLVLHLKAVGDSEALIVGTVGGHYLAGFSRATSGAPLALPLEPRCGRHRLALPSYSGALVVKLKRGTAEAKPVQVEAGNAILHYSSSGTPWTLTATITNDTRSSTFEYDSSATVPPPVIPLQATKLGLTWTPPAAYGWGGCPEAELGETGQKCPLEPSPAPDLCKAPALVTPKPTDPEAALSQRREAACQYTCTLPKSSNVQVPVRVRFSTCDDEHWEEQLGEVGSTLRGYVPSSERKLRIRMDPKDWDGVKLDERVGNYGARADYLELRASGTATYRVILRNDPTVRVPGVEVGDYVAYRYVGDRQYEERTTRVRPGGEIEILPPHKLIDDNVALGFALGGGWMPPPSGLDFDVGRFRNYVSLEAILAFHWLVRARGNMFFAPDVELRFGALVGEQWSQGIPVDSGDPESQVESSLQWRVPITANLVFHFADDVYWGFGAGPVLSFPWNLDDRDRVELQLGGLAQAFFGWRAARAFAVELGARGIWPEDVLSYDVDLSSGQAPRAHEDQAFVWLVPDVRLRLDF